MKVLGKRIPLPEWGRQYGLHPQVTWRMYRDGRLPSHLVVEKMGNRLYVQVPESEAKRARTAAYARVSSKVQAPDLVRQADVIQRFAVSQGIVIDELVLEITPDLQGNRRKLLRLLADETVDLLLVEHQHRLSSFGFEMIEACFHARGGRVLTVEKEGENDNILRDLTEILEIYCARLYGIQSAHERATRAVRAASENIE